jgi:hypothetical protein
MADARSAPRRRDTDPLLVLLRYVAEVEHAVLARDSLRITSLLRKRIAMHLPREVRDELLAFSRMPRESLRAPIRFLRFQHRMTELARGGEHLLTAQTELPLETPAAAGSIRLADDRRAAAHESRDGEGNDR